MKKFSEFREELNEKILSQKIYFDDMSDELLFDIIANESVDEYNFINALITLYERELIELNKEDLVEAYRFRSGQVRPPDPSRPAPLSGLINGYLAGKALSKRVPEVNKITDRVGKFISNKISGSPESNVNKAINVPGKPQSEKPAVQKSVPKSGGEPTRPSAPANVSDRNFRTGGGF